MTEKKQPRSKKSIREQAYEALLAVTRDGMQSHLVIRGYLQKMENSTDRAFFLRLVEGTLEYRLQLDYVIDQYSKTRTAKMRPGIREILRMAVYQILYMDSVPDRAAVSEAVKLTAQKGFAGLRGFVNGVLRTIAREKENICRPDPEEENIRRPDQKEGFCWPDRDKESARALSVRWSVGEDLIKAWLPVYGAEKTEAICRAFLKDRPLAVRIYKEEMLPENGQEIEASDILPHSGFLRKGLDPASLAAFREGQIYVQDLSSQLAVTAAGIRPGDRVLDLCAAPGGKSLLAVSFGAQVCARDLTEEKADRIRENAARCLQTILASEKEETGIEKQTGAAEIEKEIQTGIAEIDNERQTALAEQSGKRRRERLCAEAADACVYDPACEAAFEVVIADLPCSGFGVAGRKPEIKYKPYRETVSALAEIQKKILANAVRYVRPGGKLLYSTCTIAREENEDQVRWLLDTFPLQPEKPAEPVYALLQSRGISYTETGVQLLPCDGPWDGFFFAVLHRD